MGACVCERYRGDNCHAKAYFVSSHCYIPSSVAVHYLKTELTYLSSQIPGVSIIIIIIISAHKSDLSNPWSQTQASLSILSLHPKNTNKRREREEKNNRRENLPRSDRRGRENIKQEQKNKSKDPPRISERQIDKQAKQTKCQDHTNCRYRTRVAKHTPPVAGGGGQRTVKR